MTVGKDIPFLEMRIADVFRLTDGPLVLVGPMSSTGRLKLPCSGEILCDGRVVSVVKVLSERMPGPALPRGYRTVEIDAELPIEIGVLQTGGATLRLPQQESTRG